MVVQRVPIYPTYFLLLTPHASVHYNLLFSYNCYHQWTDIGILLTEVHTSFRRLGFHLMSFATRSCHIYLGSYGHDSFSNILVSDDLDSFEEELCRPRLCCNSSGDFLEAALEVKDHGNKPPSSLSRTKVYAVTWFSVPDAHLGHWLASCRCASPLTSDLIFGKKSLCAARTWGDGSHASFPGVDGMNPL